MKRYLAAAALSAALLTGCAATGHPAQSSTTSQQDGCRTALKAVYAQVEAGNRNTGDLPVPDACKGLDQGTYTALAMQAAGAAVAVPGPSPSELYWPAG